LNAEVGMRNAEIGFRILSILDFGSPHFGVGISDFGFQKLKSYPSSQFSTYAPNSMPFAPCPLLPHPPFAVCAMCFTLC
jgi:hypothetical protein